VVIAGPFSQSALGIDIVPTWPTFSDGLILSVIVVGGVAAGLLPAIRAYRMSLSDGLSLRI
ncbi:MAG: ABC transporter permease, partial [Chromatiales bacterium]|nr:ABC transporter permease [Chromatiales bacterium]